MAVAFLVSVPGFFSKVFRNPFGSFIDWAPRLTLERRLTGIFFLVVKIETHSLQLHQSSNKLSGFGIGEIGN